MAREYHSSIPPVRYAAVRAPSALQVIWVGRSSMQVQVELSRRDGAGGPGRPWTFIGFAVFVLVARTSDRTAGAQVPPLVPRTARERELFECGKVRRMLVWGTAPEALHVRYLRS